MEYSNPVFDPARVQEKENILQFSLPLPAKPDCGIYFLIEGNEIVYVGQSIDCDLRVRRHIFEGEKVFSRYHIMPCHQDHLNLYEAYCLWKFQPKYNTHIPIQQFVTVFGAYVKKRGIKLKGKGMAQIVKMGGTKRYWSVKELDNLFASKSA